MAGSCGLGRGAAARGGDGFDEPGAGRGGRGAEEPGKTVVEGGEEQAAGRRGFGRRRSLIFGLKGAAARMRRGRALGPVADGLGDVDAGAAGGEKEPGEGGGEPDRLRARSARGGVRFFPESRGALIG